MISAILTRGQTGVNPMELEWCPSTSSLVGADPESNVTRILPIRCRRWNCRYCRRVNLMLLCRQAIEGQPNRLLTLTCRPLAGETPVDTHKRVRPSVGRLYHELRRRYDKFEAMTFLETHRSGFPHWHALVRSDYLPWAEVQRLWKDLTGNFVVDLRRIKHAAVATRYVTKYVTKQLVINLEDRLGRVVTRTRGYLLSTKTNPADDRTWERDKRHPLAVVDESYPGWSVTWDGRAATLTPPTKKKEESRSAGEYAGT